MPEDTRGEDTTDVDSSMAVDRSRGDPRPAAVAFLTTEHFTLQGARAATIAESTGRASMFLFSVSGGLVALGLVATTSRVGTAFYAFGLVLLPTLTFVGFVTFERVISTVLAGSAIGLLTAVASEHSLAAALVAGGGVAVAALAAMMRMQESAWERSTSAPNGS
jgi:hypothetical protein